MMISDEGALEDIVFTHRHFKSEEEAAEAAFKQDVNIELGPNTKLTIYSFLKPAYDKETGAASRRSSSRTRSRHFSRAHAAWQIRPAADGSLQLLCEDCSALL